MAIGSPGAWEEGPWRDEPDGGMKGPSHLSFMLTVPGLLPRLNALRMPDSSSVGCGGSACRRALRAGGNVRLSAASVAGRPRQNATSAGSPATEAMTAIRAAVLQAHTT